MGEIIKGKHQESIRTRCGSLDIKVRQSYGRFLTMYGVKRMEPDKFCDRIAYAIGVVEEETGCEVDKFNIFYVSGTGYATVLFKEKPRAK